MNQSLSAANLAYQYSAYGMAIESSFPLPELAYGAPLPAAAPTLRIRDGVVTSPPAVRDRQVTYLFDADGSHFHWDGVGAFHVSADGGTVTIDRPADVSDDLIAFPLLGPILSEVLRRRGLFVLHASAAAIDGAGFALLADKGTGKSSTAAALFHGGARLLADDLVAINPDTGQIKPGFAQIKLEAPKVEHSLPRPGWIVRPAVHDKIDKVRVLLPGAMAQGDTPAQVIYVLERGTEKHAVFEPLPADMALPALLRFAFAPRFGKEALRGADGVAHFRAATAICQRVPVRRLRAPNGLDGLTGLIDEIRADLDAHRGGRV